MPRRVEFQQVDVFTRTVFAGNPAAVVLGADGLSDATMQSIAKEMNLSETAFVFDVDREGCVPVRFFTPACEVPVCGHATLGAHFVRAQALGEATGSVRQRSPGGRWEVRWQSRDGGSFLTMLQGPIELGSVWQDDLLEALLAALGLKLADLLPGWPVQTVISTGSSKAYVPVRDAARLSGLRPDFDRLRTLSESSGANGFFAFAMAAGHIATTARMFAPAIGIPEDPVNGSGHGPLATYLLERSGSSAKLAAAGFWSSMGEQLGRPGQVWVKALTGDRLVEVGGFVTPALRGELIISQS